MLLKIKSATPTVRPSGIATGEGEKLVTSILTQLSAPGKPYSAGEENIAAPSTASTKIHEWKAGSGRRDKRTSITASELGATTVECLAVSTASYLPEPAVADSLGLY